MTPFDVLTAPIPSGQVLLEASAGTGKTTTITGLVVRCLLEKKVQGLGNILIVTFTNAATEELKTRIRSALHQTLAACRGHAAKEPYGPIGRSYGAAGIPVLEGALAAADEMSVCTIHSFCRRVLAEAAFETGMPFQLDFVQDDSTQTMEAAQDALREIVHRGNRQIAQLADQAELTPEELVQLHQDWQRYPDTILQPDPPPLAEVLAALSELNGKTREHLTPAAFEALSSTVALDKDPAFGLRKAQALHATLVQRSQDSAAYFLDLLHAIPAEKPKVRKKGEAAPTDAARPLVAHCAQVREALATGIASLKKELLLQMHARLSGGKAKSSVLSLDDLLREVGRAISDPSRGPLVLAAIRKRWQIALIDEFQDTDPLQYHVFRTAFTNLPLFLVGDPKQSIYAFRGADVHAYLRARDDATTKGTLNRNFRSHPQLVAAVDHLFRGPCAFAESRITMPKVSAALSPSDCALIGCDGAPMQIRYLVSPPTGKNEPSVVNKRPLERRIANDLADEIVRLLGTNVCLSAKGGVALPLRAGDIAVLTRTAKQAALVQSALRARRIHSALARSGNLFDCDEITDVRRILAGILRMHDLKLLRGAWTTTLYGIAPSELAALEKDQARLQAETDQAGRLRQVWIRRGFAVMFHTLLELRQVRSRLLALPDGERRLTNYLQAAELLTHAAAERKLLPEALARWLERQCQEHSELAAELRELRMESDADAVQVMTMHVSKGLEYDVVFVPFLALKPGGRSNKALHVHREGGGRALVEAKDAAAHELDAAARDQIAEETRIAYVALTRAKRRTYVYWAVSKECIKTGLGYLFHGPGRTSQPQVEVKKEWWKSASITKKRYWQQELQSLADRSQGAIDLALFSLEEPPLQVASDQAAETQLAKARPLPTHVPATWTTISFSLLQRGAKHADLGRDLAEPSHVPQSQPVDVPPSGIHAFAAGAKAGTCLHEILEHTDFAQTGAPSFAQQVRSTLQLHGLLDPAAHRQPIEPVAPVTAALHTVCSTKLPGLGFAFADLAKGRSRAEWAFWLPTGKVRPRDLASLFARTGNPGYAERLRSMADSTMAGYFHGVIDLLCEQEGRYYVVDWKSNLLGATDADYTQERMQAELDANHYTLQYHLYLVAVHRLLRSRIEDYDYDRHMGGAAFVFLRGAHHATRGVVFDRPARARIEALERWITG
jgi:exodeoxyribonuclease V beta subunit